MDKNRLKKVLEAYKNKMQYTGFTTKCKVCNTEVKSTYIGQNEDNVASFELTCHCDNNSRSIDDNTKTAH